MNFGNYIVASFCAYSEKVAQHAANNCLFEYKCQASRDASALFFSISSVL